MIEGCDHFAEQRLRQVRDLPSSPNLLFQQPQEAGDRRVLVRHIRGAGNDYRLALQFERNLPADVNTKRLADQGGFALL